MRVNVVLVVVALIAAASVGWWLYDAQKTQQVATPETAPEIVAPVEQKYSVIREEPPLEAPMPTLPEAPPQPSEPELPPAPETLSGSDPAFAEALAILSPRLLQWITPKEQVRKWVSLVNNVAAGEIPVKNRPIKYHVSPFKTEQSDGGLYLSPKNYERASALIDALVAADQDEVMQYYRAWKPVLEQAYNELGLEDTFEERLLLAIENVLNTPVLEHETIALKRPLVFYTFAEPELEKASELQKFLWRLGPDNTHKLQLYLEDFALRFQQEQITEPTTIETPQ